MLKKLADLIESLGSAGAGPALGHDELQVATAALLVHAAAIDGEFAAAERTTLTHLLAARFELSPTEADDLIAAAEAREAEAVDIYRFTRVLQERLGQDGRKEIVRLMWEVVAADGEIDEFESNLVWRAAELIGVSTRDRIALRRRVLAGAGGQGR
jgi:uncharacterized tellurite resistance protein B-like protein